MARGKTSLVLPSTENNLTKKLDEWYEIYKDFLDEKTIASIFSSNSK